MPGSEQQTPAQQLIGDFAPKLVSLTDDVLFGDIWEREELSKRDRSLITVATLVAGGNTEQLPGHLARARANGLTDAELKAVVVRHGRWYLLCWSRTTDARRAYRIDRVRAVEVLDDTFSPPAGLDPVATLEEHLAVGWEYDVDAVIEAPIETAGRCLPRALGRLEPLDAGTTRLVGSTSNPVWYAQQLAAIPAPYRIVRCPELQEATRVLGQRLLAAAGASPR